MTGGATGEKYRSALFARLTIGHLPTVTRTIVLRRCAPHVRPSVPLIRRRHVDLGRRCSQACPA